LFYKHIPQSCLNVSLLLGFSLVQIFELRIIVVINNKN
jgi:hypothetical protein